VKAKRPIEAVLTAMASVLVVLLLSTTMSAAGFGVAPAHFEVVESLAGEQYRQTISMKFIGEGECTVDLSARGDIADWVTFYGLDDPDTPIEEITAIGRQWTYVMAEFVIPDGTPVGTATGTLVFVTGPSDSAEGGQAVNLQGGSRVAIDVVGTLIREGTTDTIVITAPALDFTEQDAEVGRCAANLSVEVRNAPAGASISLRATKQAPDEAGPGFALAAANSGFEIVDIAYVFTVEKGSLTPDNVGRVVVTMKVGRGWADAHGVESIRILRVSDDTHEILPTVFVGYEEDCAVFEGISEGGLSFFGLASLRRLESPTNWAMVGGLVGGILPIAAALGFIAYRRRNGLAKQ